MSEDDVVARGLERLKVGEPTALADLFSFFRDRLWRTIEFRIDPRLHGRIDPDDVLQESFISANQRIRHYLADPSRSFFIWLRLIVNQTLVDVHRRHLGAKMRDANLEVSLSPGGSRPASSRSLAEHLLARLTSPSRAAMRAEMAARVEEALANLDPIDREVLVLRHFEELTNNEVAEVLGMRKSATSNRYVRALARLRGVLSAMPGVLDGMGD